MDTFHDFHHSLLFTHSKREREEKEWKATRFTATQIDQFSLHVYPCDVKKPLVPFRLHIILLFIQPTRASRTDTVKIANRRIYNFCIFEIFINDINTLKITNLNLIFSTIQKPLASLNEKEWNTNFPNVRNTH